MTVNMPPHDTSRTAPAESADWRQHSACRNEDPDLWFPLGTTGPFIAQTEQAKDICNTRCPVVNQCLSYALESRQMFGVWGGLDEDERRRMLGVRRPRLRYGDGSVVAELLTERRAELDTLLGRGLTGGPLARALGTNTQTVNNVLRALEEQADQAEMGLAS